MGRSCVNVIPLAQLRRIAQRPYLIVRVRIFPIERSIDL